MEILNTIIMTLLTLYLVQKNLYQVEIFLNVFVLHTCLLGRLRGRAIFFVFSFLGVIIHAAYDFPIQVYSICLLLILILASTSLREQLYSRQSSITHKKML